VFDTVLIANRGEIALRIARTCRELGVRTVAVYSTEDADSAVVRYADAAVHIGPGAPRRSYLNIPAIMEAAFQSGADAIHPGYGLLSENPDLAEVCAANDITFIGPPAAILAALGDKTAARRQLTGAGLPVLPGSLDAIGTVAEAERLADEVGFPLIVKAAAGGGGRGMRVITGPGDVARRYLETRATAQTLFGDGRVYLERYLAAARHVEIQVLCDGFGNGVHLGERDCSVQRRHQKLIEETPAPRLPPALTAEMGAAAVRAAVATGYIGVGTFEFLVDDRQRYYFMEVNPRIQVEHPVTELVTGLDLVAEQLHVAAGGRLRLAQGDVVRRGAAIECRVNAENPDRDFAPTPGTIAVLDLPGGPFVRVDTAARAGARISASYDSLVAKVVVWAPDRDGALARMRRALREFDIRAGFEARGEGLHTTRDFLLTVLDDPDFVAGTHTTALVESLTKP
jgi:acetyl-CoA carboxylase, biotin carboxylase subunit